MIAQLLLRHGCEMHHPIARGSDKTMIDICQDLKLNKIAGNLKLLGHTEEVYGQLYRMRVGRKVEDPGKTIEQAREMLQETEEAAEAALRAKPGPRAKFFDVKST